MLITDEPLICRLFAATHAPSDHVGGGLVARLTPALLEDQAAYLQARGRATQLHMLRLLAAALREGLMASGDYLTLSDPHTKHTQALHTAEEITHFLYHGDRQQPLVLQWHHDGISEALTDISVFWNGVLKKALQARLADQFDEGLWQRLQYELIDSLNNETLACLAQQHMHEQWQHSVHKADNLWHWFFHNPEATTLLSDLGHTRYSLLMQLGSFSGHRTHPTTKTKLHLVPTDHSQRHPLSAEQIMQAAPEFAPDVPMLLLAARKDAVTLSLSASAPDGYDTYFKNHFPEVWQQWHQALVAAVGEQNASAYLPFPVHPLQLPEIKHRFEASVANQALLILDGVTLAMRPTLSFRTLQSMHDAPQIKTALNMLMTSEVRTLGASETYNTPILSDLLLTITSADKALHSVLRPMAEPVSLVMGTHLVRGTPAYENARQLATLFKEPLSHLVGAGEEAVPVSALFAPSPCSGAPVLIDIMRANGVAEGDTAIAYFKHYAQIVIAADIGLLARYGVGLEGHQQNTDMVFDASGAPAAKIHRDTNGGVLVHLPTLTQSGYGFNRPLHSQTNYGIYDKLDPLLSQATHTTLMSHLFPVIELIAHHYHIPKAPLLSALKETITATIDQAAHDLPEASSKERLEHIKEALLDRDIQTKCLLGMRVQQTQDLHLTAQPNPLR